MPRIPVDTIFDVYLARDLANARASIAQRPLAVITPDRDNWNDFGRNFRASLWIVDSEDNVVELRTYLLFEGRNRTRQRVNEALGEALTIKLAALDHPHCSILAEAHLYQRLIQSLGFDDAVGALRDMGDAVVAIAEGDAEEVLGLIHSTEFYESALRDEKTWGAFRYGRRHLRPDPPDDVGDAASSFSMTSDLPGLPNPYQLDADFTRDALLRDRILVLVGRNGTGKTRLLASLIDGLRAGAAWPQLRGNGPAAAFDPPPHLTRLAVLSSVSTDQYPREIPPWAGLDYCYFSMIGDRVGSSDALTMALVDCLRHDFENTPFNDNSSRMNLLDSVINGLGFKPGLFVQLRPPEGDEILGQTVEVDGVPYLRLFAGYGEQRRLQLIARIVEEASPVVILNGSLRTLSSGEQALLRFAAFAVASVQRGTIFLFDEPETHLHPNFISQFMAMLDRLLVLTGSAAMIATHSAYIVREVPSKRVRILSLSDGQALVDAPRMQTFGASIDAVSQFVFADTATVHLYQDMLRQWVESQGADLTIDAIVEAYGGDLNSETLSFMARVLRERGPQ